MKWGFAGYGRIARKFEENLRHTDEKVVAIASRSGYKQVKSTIRAYSSYEELFSDPEVEIVYINTTHNNHYQQTISAIEAGKHVLCEKPMATSVVEVQKMIDSARLHNRFLMEAIWTRYLPAYQKVMEIIRSGGIGTVQFISAHFGFRMNPDDPKERLINPDLAAGAVWDVGIYPLSLVQDIFVEDPANLQVIANLSDLNVENRVTAQMEYSRGRMAQISCAIDLTSINHALISGDKGQIIMKDFWKCEHFSTDIDGKIESFNYPLISTGLCYEAMACSKYINEGRIESPLISFENSLQLSKIMEDVISLARSTGSR